jgi:hypothetical protein
LLQNSELIGDVSTANNSASASVQFIVPTRKGFTTQLFMPCQFTGEPLSEVACRKHSEKIGGSNALKNS